MTIKMRSLTSLVGALNQKNRLCDDQNVDERPSRQDLAPFPFWTIPKEENDLLKDRYPMEIFFQTALRELI